MKQWAKRVVLFGVDGAGTFFEQTPTPNIDRIFRNGAVCRRALTELPSISAECWGSILHGVDCRRHGLTNWATGKRTFPTDSPYPSVFRVIRENRPNAEMASFCEWGNVNYGIIENNLGVYEVNAEGDELIQAAVDYINGHDFTLIYFHFDIPDGAGHAHGYGSPEHLASITLADSWIGRVTEAIEKRGWLEDTLLLVEPDHGGTPPDEHGRGSHGGDSDAEKYVCFFAAGGGAQHTELHDMLTRDTAPAILHALGLPIPDTWNSRVPGGLFADVPENLPRPEGLPVQVEELKLKKEYGRFEEELAGLKPALHLPFSTPDALPEGTERMGKLYLVDGLREKAMRFDDGALRIPCPLEGGSVSFTAWLRLDAVENRMPVLSVRCAEDGSSWICIAATGEDHLVLSVKLRGVNKPRHMEVALPAKRTGTWIFAAGSFDAEAGTAGFSINFEPVMHQLLPGREIMGEGEKAQLLLGIDDLSTDEQRFPGELEDVCVYNKALTDEDIAKLKAYYLG